MTLSLFISAKFASVREMIRLSCIFAYRDIFFFYLRLILIGLFFLHHGVRWKVVDYDLKGERDGTVVDGVVLLCVFEKK